MFSKLLSVSLLIALLNAHYMQAHPPVGRHFDMEQGANFYGPRETWDQRPQRGPEGNGYRHHHHHHRNHHVPYGQYPGNYPYYGGDYYPGQPIAPGAGQQVPYFGGQQPGGPGAPYFGGPGRPEGFAGYPQQPRRSDVDPQAGPFRPGFNAGQQPGFQQPAAAGSDDAFQPRPNGFNVDNTDFQRPSIEQGSKNAEGSLQPRPGLNGETNFGFQQPGLEQTGNTFQSRPGQGNKDPTQFGFQQPDVSGQGVNGNGASFQPRPGPGVNSETNFGFQQPEGTGAWGPFQSPPDQAAQLGGKQQSDVGFQQSGNAFQPRPVDQQLNFNTRTQNDDKPKSSVTQSGFQQPAPVGEADSANVGDNIQHIFNTNDFISPTLIGSQPYENTNHLNTKNPKDDSEQVTPKSVDQRGLFETLPLCTNGAEVMGGRCRKSA